MNDYRVLGLIEVADLLDVDKRTPHAWNYRGLLPNADHASVNGSPAWQRDTIICWAAKTGRLPEHLWAEVEDPTIERPARRGGRDAKALIAKERDDA